MLALTTFLENVGYSLMGGTRFDQDHYTQTFNGLRENQLDDQYDLILTGELFYFLWHTDRKGSVVPLVGSLLYVGIT
jgi:pyridoxal/pyridoxine/pyridoxamine kinase